MNRDPAEVSYSGSGGNRSGRRRAGQTRALDVTEAAMTLRHDPTGAEARGTVPPGHYSRRQMRDRKAELYRRLFAELEREVARRLRIPGR